MCGAGINDFPNASLADVAAALPVLRDYGVPLVVHAELDDGTTAQARPPPRSATLCPTRWRRWCTLSWTTAQPRRHGPQQVQARHDPWCGCADGGCQECWPWLCWRTRCGDATGSGPGVQGDPRLHATWAASHPPSWERAAVRGLLGVLREEMQNGAPKPALRRGGDDARAGSGGFGLHIAHVADASVVDMLDAARAEGAALALHPCWSPGWWRSQGVPCRACQPLHMLHALMHRLQA